MDIGQMPDSDLLPPWWHTGFKKLEKVKWQYPDKTQAFQSILLICEMWLFQKPASKANESK